MQATAAQKKIIHTITPNRDIKEEWVQWATEDVSKISTNDLTFDQANKILVQNNLPSHKLSFWAKFDKNNKQHMYILSLCIQYGWVAIKKGRRFANLDELNNWLHGKSPVKKALEDMEPDELTDVINALSSMMLKKNEKPIKL